VTAARADLDIFGKKKQGGEMKKAPPSVAEQ